MSREDLIREESEALVFDGAAGGRVAGVFPAYRDLAAEGAAFAFCLGMMLFVTLP